MKTQTESDIAREIEEEIREITKPENRFAEWINDYAIIILGLLTIIASVFWLHQTFQGFSLSVSELSELTSNADMAKANVDKINTVLGYISIQVSSLGASLGKMAMGLGVLGIGLAWYTYRSGVRANQIITAATTSSSQIMRKHIDYVVGRAVQSVQLSHQPIDTNTLQENPAGRKKKGTS